MLLQAALRRFTVLIHLTAVFEPPDEFAHEGKVTLWLDRDRDQVGTQAMCQPPGIADDLAGMWPGIEAHQHPLAGRSVLTDAVIGHELLLLFLGLLPRAPQFQFAPCRQS